MASGTIVGSSQRSTLNPRVGAHPSRAVARISDYGWPFLFAVAMAFLYVRHSDASLWAALSLLAGLVLFSSNTAHISLVDWCVLILVVFEILSFFYSQNSQNSIRFTLGFALAATSYLATRLTIRSGTRAAVLSGLVGLGGALLALPGIGQFNQTAARLRGVGLTSLVAFRSLLIAPRSSWVSGEWFTLVLLTLPFSFAAALYLWRKNLKRVAVVCLVPALPISVALTLSLSRAVLWSLIALCVTTTVFLLWARIVAVKKGSLLIVSALGTLVLILAVESAFFPGVLGSYKGQHISQVRSSEGRLEIWDRSLRAAQNHPWLGVGASNSALTLGSSADLDETTGFASRTFSLPLQTLLEKGVIGVLLYGTFLVLVAREFVLGTQYSRKLLVEGTEKKKNAQLVGERTSSSERSACLAMNCCFAAGFVAVLARELVYSSLFEHTLTLVLAGILCALIVHPGSSLTT